MKIIVELTPQESEKIFYDILCNCINTGYTSGYGLQLDYDKRDYIKVRDKLNKELEYTTSSYEDVLMGILKCDGLLYMKDIEGDGLYNENITLHKVHTKIQEAPVENIKNILDETGDVTDCDIILQHMLYDEIIFG